MSTFKSYNQDKPYDHVNDIYCRPNLRNSRSSVDNDAEIFWPAASKFVAKLPELLKLANTVESRSALDNLNDMDYFMIAYFLYRVGDKRTENDKYRLKYSIRMKIGNDNYDRINDKIFKATTEGIISNINCIYEQSMRDLGIGSGNKKNKGTRNNHEDQWLSTTVKRTICALGLKKENVNFPWKSWEKRAGVDSYSEEEALKIMTSYYVHTFKSITHENGAIWLLHSIVTLVFNCAECREVSKGNLLIAQFALFMGDPRYESYNGLAKQNMSASNVYWDLCHKLRVICFENEGWENRNYQKVKRISRSSVPTYPVSEKFSYLNATVKPRRESNSNGSSLDSGTKDETASEKSVKSEVEPEQERAQSETSDIKGDKATTSSQQEESSSIASSDVEEDNESETNVKNEQVSISEEKTIDVSNGNESESGSDSGEETTENVNQNENTETGTIVFPDEKPENKNNDSESVGDHEDVRESIVESEMSRSSNASSFRQSFSKSQKKKSWASDSESEYESEDE